MHEKLRKSYRPDSVKVLFIGESPPDTGDFFYSGNTKLLRFTRVVFEEVNGIEFESNEDFLDHFKKTNFYLDDLCYEPINKLSTRQRCLMRENSIASLAKRIKKSNPEYIVIFVKEIKEYVEAAIENSGLKEDIKKVYPVPFPYMRKNEENYKKELSFALIEIQEA